GAATEERESHGTWLGVGLEPGPNGKGVTVQQVYDGSPADRAGLQEGDVILSIDGQSTPDAAALTRAVRQRNPGDKITLRISREGNEQTVTATLGERQTHVKVLRIPGGNGTGHAWALNLPDMKSVPRAWMGVATSDLTPELRRHFGASEKEGVLVAQVRQGSPADKAGVRVGDVLTSVGGHTVTTPSDVADAIRDKDAGEQVNLDLVREGRARTVSLTLAERPGMQG